VKYFLASKYASFVSFFAMVGAAWALTAFAKWSPESWGVTVWVQPIVTTLGAGALLLARSVLTALGGTQTTEEPK